MQSAGMRSLRPAMMPYPGLLALLSVLVLATEVLATVPWYSQCGGRGYDGPTTCDPGAECKFINEYYSQCEPLPSGDRPGPWEQCGGRTFDGFLCNGIQCCSSGLQCIYINDFFSQCIPEGELADIGEPCGPATPDNKRCLLQSRSTGPVFGVCSSDTDPDAECVFCGFRGLACCPPGVFRPDRPQCQAAPRFTAEIPCTDEGICEGDVIQQDYE